MKHQIKVTKKHITTTYRNHCVVVCAIGDTASAKHTTPTIWKEEKKKQELIDLITEHLDFGVGTVEALKSLDKKKAESPVNDSF